MWLLLCPTALVRLGRHRLDKAASLPRNGWPGLLKGFETLGLEAREKRDTDRSWRSRLGANRLEHTQSCGTLDTAGDKQRTCEANDTPPVRQSGARQAALRPPPGNIKKTQAGTIPLLGLTFSAAQLSNTRATGEFRP